MTTPPPFGDPEQPWGTPPQGYGAPPPGYGGQPTYRFAGWGSRFGAYLVDYSPFIVAAVVLQVSTGLGVVLYLAAFAFVFWNLARQGTTGQSVGKGVLGIKVVKEADGTVLGAGLSIGRYFVHILDAIPCYLGFLWPLWDAKKQTFADKILKNVVVAA